MVLHLLLKLPRPTRQSVVHLAQSFAELTARAGGNLRSTQVDVQNRLDLLSVLFFIENDLDDGNGSAILIKP